MTPVKPDNRDLQQQVTELPERVTRLESAYRPNQNSSREMILRMVIIILVFSFLCGFAYCTFRASVLNGQPVP